MITESAGSTSAELFLERKKKRIDLIYSDPVYRRRILNGLCLNAPHNQIEFADVAVVLGTSPVFVDKFAKRVYWASMLLKKDFVRAILFTGESDDQTKDLNQAGVATQMAIYNFGVNEDVITMVGGNNTQENVVLAATNMLKQQYSSAFLVSTPRHLIRGMSVAKNEMKFVHVLSSPVGGWVKFDSDNLAVINELIKAEAYRGTFYGCKPQYSEDDRNYLRSQIKSILGYYDDLLHKDGFLEPIEEPFDQWYANLSDQYKINITKV